MANIEIDNNKMWLSLLKLRVDSEFIDCMFITDESIKTALQDQGLEYKDGEIVKIEPDVTTQPWTIECAQDGDILVTDTGVITMFKCIKEVNGEQRIYDHGDYDLHDDRFYPNTDSGGFFNSHVQFKPATKEERRLFFSKLMEFGYQWNPDIKKIKKTESYASESGLTEFEKELSGMLEYAKKYARPDTDVVHVFSGRLKELAYIEKLKEKDYEKNEKI